MSKLLLILVLLVAIAGFGEARHVHPHHQKSAAKNVEETDQFENTAVPQIDGMSIDTIRNIKPSHFVPVNNVIFFRQYAPCEEGLERDFFGICREVWD